MFPQIIKVVEGEKGGAAFFKARNIYEASTASECQTPFKVLETQH